MCIGVDGRAGGLLVGQSKDSFAEGKGKAATDFESCKEIAHQNLQRSARSLTGDYRLVAMRCAIRIETLSCTTVSTGQHRRLFRCHELEELLGI